MFSESSVAFTQFLILPQSLTIFRTVVAPRRYSKCNWSKFVTRC